MIKTDWNNFAPRVGLAYRLTNKTVVRTGYGIFMAGTILNPFRNSLSNQFPFVIDQVFTGTNPNPELLLLGNALPDNRRRANAVNNQGNLTQARGITREPSQSYLQSWNFTIERELFLGTAIEIDYRGSKGTHLIRRYDHNQLYRSVDIFLNAPEGATGASALAGTRPIARLQHDQFLQHGVELDLQRVQPLLAQAQPQGDFLALELLLVEVDRRRLAHARRRRYRFQQCSRFAKPAPGARALGLGSQARL